MDALALKADEGFIYCDKFRELYVSFDPKISEWGNPPLYVVLKTEYIGLKREPGELKHLSNQRKRNQLRSR